MKLFTCAHCGQLVYFENTRCEHCGYPLGFAAESLQLITLVDQGNGTYPSYGNPSITYRYCANHQYNVCNWLVADGSKTPYCRACALNHTIPNLSKPEYRQRWHVIETAKHRLVYTLLRMRLPLVSKNVDAEKGLFFDFLADENPNERILTGHANGLITINIAEADDIERELARRAMAEPYRTVLGHFRHEVGHYYWDRLIADRNQFDAFRALFSDERQDYGEALKTHYADGPIADWHQQFISAYASVHPWEDWAETWAHYLHIVDTLETAYAFGLRVQPVVADAGVAAVINTDPYELRAFDALMNQWLPLTFAMNSLNRSMGQPDMYPFVIPPAVMDKLRFIHNVCCDSRTA